MNKLLARTLTMLAVGISSVTCFATETLARQVDVIIVNDNSERVDHVYMARPGRGWGSDRFGQEVLQPGERTVIRLNIGDTASTCAYYLKAVYQDGSYDLTEKTNICEDNEITLYGEGGDEE